MGRYRHKRAPWLLFLYNFTGHAAVWVPAVALVLFRSQLLQIGHPV
jgi:hypothetical protein